MKKTFVILFLVFFIGTIFFILNIELITRQGINYRVGILKIPLYLKILNFYNRHFNYKWLVHKILEGKTEATEKVMTLLSWTICNLYPHPKELPVIDDHVWNIIIRGYGASDQFSDVFTTLCNYAGLEAFFNFIRSQDGTGRMPLSFVKIHNQWCVFDPYNAVYFIKRDGKIASVLDLASGNWEVSSINNEKRKSTVQYQDYFANILSIDFGEAHRHSRANTQSPLKRFFYFLRKKKF